MWILWVIIVGLIAGWAAGRIMGTGGYGPLVDILLGIAGGIVGGFLLSLFGLFSSGGIIPEIVVATIGAVFLIWLSRKLKKHNDGSGPALVRNQAPECKGSAASARQLEAGLFLEVAERRHSLAQRVSAG